ncbi:helix-turn-helix domain-containing protein [Pedobacter nanyangensis]|uniref:helix-turn-helix domain-containing protein n=1 Tax=Pedobacter nanyangensis TaxID=1562389 RepID=UPI000DE4FD4C|nr:helix-turn-helix domain-containing protein [Pedobacter nanyangensis]
MRKSKLSIPLKTMADEFERGIYIAKVSMEELAAYEPAMHAHRDDYHSFCFQEEGTTVIEIDFQKYSITGPAIAYIHPNQVHRMLAVQEINLSILIINSENLHPEWLKILQEIAPAPPLKLKPQAITLFRETISLCLKFWESKPEQLYQSILRDSCNALAGLAAKQYLEQAKPKAKLSSAEVISSNFRALLEHHFVQCKSPAVYAEKLNISAVYLNECLKKTTGQPVSYHIQQRVILEAKRLLYHSSQSVKEIAAELGYDDYPYFSRLFTKVVGISALSFRNRNLD